MGMILIQKLNYKINGYWDGGPKDTFEWYILPFGGGRDKKGEFVKVGSFEANHWFCISKGKTEKATLGRVKTKLRTMIAKHNARNFARNDYNNPLECTFELRER